MEKTMVEIAAEAILAEAQNMGGLAFTFPIEKRLALAVIKAMRTPTQAMLEAGVQFHIEDWRDRHQSLEKQWEAAIDAALKENEEKT